MPKLYGKGENVRDWIHVDDHNAAVVTIIERGVSGDTYLIGADGEMDNKSALELLLTLMDRPADWYEHVSDRPGHDMRYAIDASKLVNELGWKPHYTSFHDGLAATIAWYREHEDWWRKQKLATESKYALLGR
jgi:dTDP-glucose 4,6-dehydratase